MRISTFLVSLPLCVGLLLSPAMASEPKGKANAKKEDVDRETPKKEKAPESKDAKGEGKGKSGDACKSTSDCDQASHPQRCTDNKCRRVPMHPVT